MLGVFSCFEGVVIEHVNKLSTWDIAAYIRTIIMVPQLEKRHMVRYWVATISGYKSGD
ncbi:protein of unknown function [Pseudodesulfovibrio profundus]|uniref:Uncharacterized protein n=1 Tax=Pseudodesulfovibrio profundus TaxID=57320 RepID=A0A2C8FD43_9BACT|nr:protein of unknown function [Pseudodesulfovibrio profundus]